MASIKRDDPVTRERGFALAAAVFALVVIATLIAGAFFSARMEVNIGRSTATYQRAFNAAETGLDFTMATWRTSVFNNLAVGDSAMVSDTVPGGGGSWTAIVRRLNPDYFFVRVIGRDPTATSERQISSLARLQRISMEIYAGLTTRGNLTLGGSSFIDGRDGIPSGWSDCPTEGLSTLSGVRTKDSSLIRTSGCTNFSCVNGNPKVEQDPSVNDSTFFQYGGLNYDQLAAIATLQLPGGQTWTQMKPSTTSGICNTSDNKNWGEPYRTAGFVAACVGYFPILHVNGNAIISNGRGQGILLVDGNLAVNGNFEWVGPVVVRGQFDTAGTGNKFQGGVLAANASLQESDVLGNAVVTYSSCSIARALKFAVPARQFSHRAWADLIQ